MAKILILGSSGLLGTSLFQYLLNESSHVIFPSHNLQSHKRLFDCSDPARLHEYLTSISPDVIINLVAITNVDLCERDPQLAYLFNSLVVKTVAEWINSSNPDTRLIQLSTDQLYDDPGPSDVEGKISLKNYYSYSKYLGELYAVRCPNHTVLRTNFFGKSLKNGRSSFTDWLHGLLDSHKTINLFNDVIFSPLSLDTLCGLLKSLLDCPLNGTYNIGSSDSISKHSFGLHFAKLIGADISLINSISIADAKLIAYRPRDMSMNSSFLYNNLLLPSYGSIRNQIMLESKKYSLTTTS